nr:glycosyltransferase [Serinibacter salmoneus]
MWHLRAGGVPQVKEFLRRRDAAGRRGAAVRVRRNRRGVATVEVEPWDLPPSPQRRSDLRVGVILDDFSRLAFGFEWTQVPVTPETWREVTASGIDLLFVESAWHGNQDAWQYQLTGSKAPSAALRELVAHCRDAGVPTVFWNKEDPTHFADFLETARLFDQVFTTDGDRVPEYRQALGHDRVGVLPFAAQPAVHNPIRRARVHQERDIAFAGMYFSHTHAERREQMDLLLGAALDVSPQMEHGLEIYSRQLGGDERYQFPPPLDSRVIGSLPYAKMLAVYRDYKVFLNVNTVTSSPTMCARRIFEISASGTPVVSTPSAAIGRVFPQDEVAQVEDRDEAGNTLRALVRNPELRDRMVHRAQRRIWDAHTYAHRVDDVLESVGLDAHAVTRARPRVTALVSSIRPHQLDHVVEMVSRQQDVDVQLAFLAHGWDVDEGDLRARAREAGIGAVSVLRGDVDTPLGVCLNRLVTAADGDYVAKMDDDDLYGPRYLADAVHALTYSRAQVVGKQAHYVHFLGEDVLALRFKEREHRFTHFVMGPTIVATRGTVSEVRFPDRTLGEDTGFLERVTNGGGRIYSADRFGFAQVRGGSPHTWNASDMEMLAQSDVVMAGMSEEHVHA